MEIKIKKITIWLCAFTLQLATVPVIADESGQRSWYLGAGLGISEIDPDTDDTGYRVTDERDSGFKLFGGFDYSERLTIEGFYVDLGSAQLSSSFPSQPDGEIDYSTFGASALWYFVRNGDNTGKNLRKGLQVYAHGGLSFLDNSSSITFSQDNGVQVQYGAGIEYGFNDGVAVRAGIDLYDKDAGMVFVGVLKRFGTESKRKIMVVEPVQSNAVSAVNTTISAPATSVPADGSSTSIITVQAKDSFGNNLLHSAGIVTLESTGSGSIGYISDNNDGTYTATINNGVAETITVSGTIASNVISNTAAVIFTIVDADADGVADSLDECPDSPAGIKVDELGCSTLAIEIAGVNFELASFELTRESKVILDEAVMVISANPELQFEVQAHTDYKGLAKANQELSEQRALSVKAYLVSKGVNENQLTAKGYGESQPIADNKTEAGRAKNRRVELKVIKDDVTEVDTE